MSRKALSGFKNSSYFIFPLKIASQDKLADYLSKNRKWEKISSGFETNYLMFYADNMKKDDRFRCYTYAEQEKPNIYLFDDNADSPDNSPELGEIRGCKWSV